MKSARNLITVCLLLTAATMFAQTTPSFGYAGVLVKAKRKELLALLRRGLRSKKLAFPSHNGAVEWPDIQLIKKAA